MTDMARMRRTPSLIGLRAPFFRFRGVLFRQDVLRRIGEGEVTLAFRRWRRPTVRAGGTLRTRIGVLAIESVEVVDESDVSDADARRAGALDREAVLREGPRDRPLYRVEFRLAGPDPRVALRRRRKVSDDERAEIDARLARLDAASRHGPWTRAVLGLIAERPGTRAPDLAASIGRETAPFKADVRKLKELGLTESLEVGYRLSPRGRAYYG
jgi:hypothetical protein